MTQLNKPQLSAAWWEANFVKTTDSGRKKFGKKEGKTLGQLIAAYQLASKSFTKKKDLKTFNNLEVVLKKLGEEVKKCAKKAPDDDTKQAFTKMQNSVLSAKSSAKDIKEAVEFAQLDSGEKNKRTKLAKDAEKKGDAAGGSWRTKSR